MSPRRLIAILLGAAVLTGLPAAGAGASSRAPARLLVYGQEWSLWPSRASVPAGPVLIQFWNRGQDPHDVRIRALHHGWMTGRTQGVSVTGSGRLASAAWRLAPGTYELYCSLAGHLHAGMHTRLVVR